MIIIKYLLAIPILYVFDNVNIWRIRKLIEKLKNFLLAIEFIDLP